MSQKVRKLIWQITLSSPLIRLYDRVRPAKCLGSKGERAAARYFLRRGNVIVARGYQDKFGEIDLIVVDGQTLVFVEVKTRTSDIAGLPAEAVDERKQEHLTKTAYGYLKWNRLTECRARFDVVAITWPSVSPDPELVHYQNAFEPVGQFQIF